MLDGRINVRINLELAGAIPKWGSADMSRSDELQFAAHVVAPGSHLGVAPGSGRPKRSLSGVPGTFRSNCQQSMGIDNFLLPLYLSPQSKGIEFLMEFSQFGFLGRSDLASGQHPRVGR